MSQATYHSFLVLLLTALRSRRAASNHSGLTITGSHVTGILAAALTLEVITLAECQRIERLAANAAQYRNREISRWLPPYGHWPLAKREVAA